MGVSYQNGVISECESAVDCEKRLTLPLLSRFNQDAKTEGQEHLNILLEDNVYRLSGYI